MERLGINNIELGGRTNEDRISKLEILTPEQAPEMYEKITPGLLRYLKNELFLSVKIVKKWSLKALGGFVSINIAILLADELFGERANKKEGWESTFLHEFGHALDMGGAGLFRKMNNVPENLFGSLTEDEIRMTREAIVETYKNLCIGGGNIDDALQNAKLDFKAARNSWLVDYQIKSGVHADWIYAKKRAFLLYGTKCSQKVIKIMGLEAPATGE